ncbi:MAG: hypothetical protein SU899_03360 [Chloroflexota bacterium]|nr:hypothetical protein [Chloroflexota bacterium]
MAVEIAKRFPEAQAFGIDTWTNKWKLWGMAKAGTENRHTLSKSSIFYRVD